MSDISIECYECGAVYKIEEDYNSGSTRVAKVVPHKCETEFGSCSSCGGEVQFGKMAEHEKTCGVVCPECKGRNVNYDGVQIIMGGSFNSYQCDDCGKCFTNSDEKGKE